MSTLLANYAIKFLLKSRHAIEVQSHCLFLKNIVMI